MRPMTFTEAFVRAQSAPSRRYLTYWQTRCDQELTRVYRAAWPVTPGVGSPVLETGSQSARV